MSVTEFHSQYFRTARHEGATVAHFLVKRLSEDLNIEQLGHDFFTLVDQNDLDALIVDMSNVEYLNSSVLGKFITLHRRLHRKSGKLVLCSPSETVREILQTSRLNDYFIVRDDLASSFAALA